MTYKLAREVGVPDWHIGLGGVVNGQGISRCLGSDDLTLRRPNKNPINIGDIEQNITLEQFIEDPETQYRIYKAVIDSTRYRNNWCDQTLYNPFPVIRVQRGDGRHFALYDTLRFRQDDRNEETCMYAIVPNEILGLIVDDYNWTLNPHQFNGYHPGIPISHSFIKVTKKVRLEGSIDGNLARLNIQSGEFTPLALKGDIVLITY